MRTGEIKTVLRKNMWYKIGNVKYWQQSDNKCQYGTEIICGIILSSLFSYVYEYNGLAQKLHYFCSPIKNTYW